MVLTFNIRWLGCTAGRRSGIWMGSTDAQLGSIQQQWNTYKARPAAALTSDLLHH